MPTTKPLGARPIDQRWFTYEEAEHFFGIPKRTLRYYARDLRVLPCFKIGNKVRFLGKDVRDGRLPRRGVGARRRLAGLSPAGDGRGVVGGRGAGGRRPCEALINGGRRSGAALEDLTGAGLATLAARRR